MEIKKQWTWEDERLIEAYAWSYKNGEVFLLHEELKSGIIKKVNLQFGQVA